jgi:FixJ family two-component response regulator
MVNKCAIVAIIDDDLLVRNVVQGLLEAAGFTVAVFGSTEEYLQISKPQSHNCIVVDTGQSLDFQAKLETANSLTPIVFIAAHGDIRMSVRAVKAGAIDFLSKPFRNRELLDAVRNGVERDRALRAEHKVVGELRVRFASLAPREREILALLSAGHEVKVIAGQLGICTHTARVHRNRVMSKIGARSIADLVRISDKLANATKEVTVRGQAIRTPDQDSQLVGRFDFLSLQRSSERARAISDAECG